MTTPVDHLRVQSCVDRTDRALLIAHEAGSSMDYAIQQKKVFVTSPNDVKIFCTSQG